MERVEAYTGRFARVVDLLVNKVLRALDRHELAGEGFRAMKEVRNIIAHDYSGAELAALLVFCRSREAELNDACNRVVAYAPILLERPIQRS